MTAAPAMTTVPELGYDARLDPLGAGDTWPSSWSISHLLGGPATGTYTEVALAPAVRDAGHPDQVLEEVVRRVAVDLYGTAWAYVYPPEQFADAIARWGLRRRERVVVTAVVVWS